MVTVMDEEGVLVRRKATYGVTLARGVGWGRR
jgi:hypothetical protein